MVDKTYIQWGRQTPDGEVTWQTADTWQPTWSTPEGRQAERDNWQATIERLGVVYSPDMDLVFLTREQQITYTASEVVVESEPEPEEPPTDGSGDNAPIDDGSTETPPVEGSETP